MKVPQDAIAQYLLTGITNNSLRIRLKLSQSVIKSVKFMEPERIAKLAVATRRSGYFRENGSSYLCAYLTTIRERALLRKVFPIVIDNGRMLRHYVHWLRSGIFGTKSLGSFAKRLICDWLDSRTVDELYNELYDDAAASIIRLVHPKPLDKDKDKLYRCYLGDSLYKYESDESAPKQHEDFITNKTRILPSVDIKRLPLAEFRLSDWCQAFVREDFIWTLEYWYTCRVRNEFLLNSAECIAGKITGENRLPCQLLKYVSKPSSHYGYTIHYALSQALNDSIANVPALSGNGIICIDGSKNQYCVSDKIGLLATCWQQPKIVFYKDGSHELVSFTKEVLRNAAIFDKVSIGGRSNCAAALDVVSSHAALYDWVIIIAKRCTNWRSLISKWRKMTRAPQSKLVCINLAPQETKAEEDDVLLINGFNDRCYKAIAGFLGNEDYLKVVDTTDI